MLTWPLKYTPDFNLLSLFQIELITIILIASNSKVVTHAQWYTLNGKIKPKWRFKQRIIQMIDEKTGKYLCWGDNVKAESASFLSFFLHASSHFTMYLAPSTSTSVLFYEFFFSPDTLITCCPVPNAYACFDIQTITA